MIHRSWWEYSISSKISNYLCWRQLKYQLTPLHLFWKHIKNVFPTSVCFKLNWIEKYTSTLIHMISFELMFSIGFILIRSKYISIGFISITFQNPGSLYTWTKNRFAGCKVWSELARTSLNSDQLVIFGLKNGLNLFEKSQFSRFICKQRVSVNY